MSALRDRLRDPKPLLLDGATGTELERRGHACALPLWSTGALIDSPELVREIHRDYAAAGAELLTANTFRTHARSLAVAGLAERARALTALAVSLAREAARTATSPPLVLGSAAPLEDCYRPERCPAPAALEREHAAHARNLAAAGVDAVLVETQNSVAEARAALRAARDAGLDALASFVCWNGATLLSGEALERGIEAAVAEGALAVLVNCLPPSNAEPCLRVLAASGLRFGIYANLGEPLPSGAFARSESCSPAEFAQHARAWLGAGATLIGGCCGTTPAQIGSLASLLRNFA
jgi:S-methylmethionine-dependent homocysteine/selenocysteine methylase